MGNIFVSIAAYRDTECYWTLKDLYDKAKYPERVFVGLCLQTSPSDDDLTKNPVQSHHGQIRVLKYDSEQSKGVCWARSKIQSLWRGEEYFLQLDAHMRFDQDWDEKLILQLKNCDSKKPVLSSYPPAYDPPNTLHGNQVSIINFAPFDAYSGMIYGFYSYMWPVNRMPERPVKRYVCICNFVFASSDIIKEVPYDPHVYWFGEEITYSVRAWTHGWDIFAPNDTSVYHWYNTKRTKHWDEHSREWWKENSKSFARVKHLLGTEPVYADNPHLVDLGKYGLGTVRSIHEYELEAGINFRTKSIIENKALTSEKLMKL